MRDVRFHTGLEGEPLVTVTLDAVEVQAITSSMYTRAQEHTKSVFDMIASGKAKQNAEYRGVEAQSESQRNAGEWLFIQGQIEEPFWAWVNETDAEYQGEHDCVCQCHGGADVAEPVCSICLCSQED